jgi:hypothetical protein
MSARVLALAAYLFDEPRYARDAARRLRVWFLDDATRMNPNLEFGQFVPGADGGKGKPSGMIETREFAELCDWVALLAATFPNEWTARDDAALREWMGRYLDWLLTSELGKKESAAKNNHATWFDVQAAGIALYVGREDVAREILRDFGERRIGTQVEPDGAQPHEFRRTRGLSYSVFNLEALVRAAQLTRSMDIDVWSFRTRDGRSIRAAIDYLLPYVTGQREWPRRQITPFDPLTVRPLLRQAAQGLHDGQYDEIASQLRGTDSDTRLDILIFPPPPQR